MGKNISVMSVNISTSVTLNTKNVSQETKVTCFFNSAN